MNNKQLALLPLDRSAQPPNIDGLPSAFRQEAIHLLTRLVVKAARHAAQQRKEYGSHESTAEPGQCKDPT